MATSTSSEIKIALNMKVRKIFLLLAIFIFLSTFSLFLQSYLIPVDAPNNKYPITFTDAAQQQLVLKFYQRMLPRVLISVRLAGRCRYCCYDYQD